MIATENTVSIESTNNNIPTGLRESAKPTPKSSVQSESTLRGNRAGAQAALSGLDTQDSTADIDVAKVERIKAGLADGSLSFSAERIADGLVESANLLTSESEE